MTSELERLDKHRGQVSTRSGRASYIDTGGPGRAVLFVHGVGTSSYLWRHVIDQLDGQRRCVAVDLPLHGETPAAADQDFSLPGLARFLTDCCDALELTDIDLVANDTGGAIAQVFAAGHPERLHTLTLTNCEAHDNLPPKALPPGILLARMGLFAPHRTPEGARHPAGPQELLRQRLPGRCQPARGYRPGLAGIAVHHGIGAPIPALAHIPARPRPAGD
jgi:pimeloyl-ACP methyl ester carboxylesterase